MSNDKINPLAVLWNALGVIGGVISLSSLTEEWFQKLFRWKGFILEIIDSYRSIVTPFFKIVFIWLPFSVPVWVHDYIVFGFIVSASLVRASAPSTKMSSFDKLTLNFVWAIGWPIFIGVVVYAYFRDADNWWSKRALQWLSALVLGVAVLFSVNARL